MKKGYAEWVNIFYILSYFFSILIQISIFFITIYTLFLGTWLAVNGEAIYDTKPWIVQNDTLTGSVWYTLSKDEKQLYASILEWPDDNILLLGSFKLSENSQIHLLGHSSVIPVSSLLLLYLNML